MKKLLSILLTLTLCIALAALLAPGAQADEVPKYGVMLAPGLAHDGNVHSVSFTPEQAAAGEEVSFHLKTIDGYFADDITFTAVGGGSIPFTITEKDYENGSTYGTFIMPDLGAVVDFESAPLSSVNVVTLEKMGEGTVELASYSIPANPPVLSAQWTFTLTPAEDYELVWFEVLTETGHHPLTPTALGDGKYLMTDGNQFH